MVESKSTTDSPAPFDGSALSDTGGGSVNPGIARDSDAPGVAPRDNKEGTPQETIEIEQRESVKRSHKKKGSKPAAVFSRAKGDGAQAARGILEIVDLLAVAQFGADAAISAEERALIEPSLAKVIEKYGDSLDRFGGFIDPILLGAGLVMYGSRLWMIARPQTSTPKQPAHQAQEVEADASTTDHQTPYGADLFNPPAASGNGVESTQPNAPSDLFNRVIL